MQLPVLKSVFFVFTLHFSKEFTPTFICDVTVWSWLTTPKQCMSAVLKQLVGNSPIPI